MLDHCQQGHWHGTSFLNRRGFARSSFPRSVLSAFHFGFRRKSKSAQSRILDASARVQEPLNLPGGSIRLILILGFAGCAVVLWARRQIINPAYLEFFIILAGLVAGYFPARSAAMPSDLSSADSGWSFGMEVGRLATITPKTHSLGMNSSKL